MPDDEPPLDRIIRQTRERARAQEQAEARQPKAWYCPACEKHRGVAARSLLHPVLIGGYETDEGTIEGGRWVMACWHCMARGKMTIAGKAL